MHVDGGPCRWYVRDGSPQAGHPIVFLHGFAGTGADWDHVKADLPAGWRAIAPDLPGHGESPLPPAISFEKFPGMMDALLDSLEAKSAVFVGYSLGARLALSLAAHLPQRVDGLILESAHPGLSDQAQRDERRVRDESDARTLDMDGLDAFFDTWHQRPVFASRRGGPGWTQEVEKRRASNHPRRLAAVMRGLGLSAQPDFLTELRHYNGPTLLIAGAHDPPYVEHAQRIQAQRPQLRRLLLAPCGHNVHTEQPLVFRDALRDFLQTIPTRATTTN